MGNRRFASELFEGMQGMGRVFLGAATVDFVLRENLIEQVAEAKLRSLFVGFGSFCRENYLSKTATTLGFASVSWSADGWLTVRLI